MIAQTSQQHTQTTQSTDLLTLEAQMHQSIRYLPPSERHQIFKALAIAYAAHDGQIRKSHEAYIVHPVAVAAMLAEWKMDSETIVAGLLHDTVEDTEMTFDDIRLIFGSNVARIVEGVTKVSKQRPVPSKLKAVENLRGMLLAMSQEWRVVVVKLADRLHNMQTLQHMPPHKQERIARETMQIFVPLAVRLGSWDLAKELEKCSLQYMNGELSPWEELNHIVQADTVLSEAGVGEKLWQHQHMWQRHENLMLAQES